MDKEFLPYEQRGHEVCVDNTFPHYRPRGSCLPTFLSLRPLLGRFEEEYQTVNEHCSILLYNPFSSISFYAINGKILIKNGVDDKRNCYHRSFFIAIKTQDIVNG